MPNLRQRKASSKANNDDRTFERSACSNESASVKAKAQRQTAHIQKTQQGSELLGPRKYKQISDLDRLKLILLITEHHFTCINASVRLSIPYTNARAIFKTFRDTGRVHQNKRHVAQLPTQGPSLYKPMKESDQFLDEIKLEINDDCEQREVMSEGYLTDQKRVYVRPINSQLFGCFPCADVDQMLLKRARSEIQQTFRGSAGFFSRQSSDKSVAGAILPPPPKPDEMAPQEIPTMEYPEVSAAVSYDMTMYEEVKEEEQQQQMAISEHETDFLFDLFPIMSARNLNLPLPMDFEQACEEKVWDRVTTQDLAKILFDNVNRRDEKTTDKQEDEKKQHLKVSNDAHTSAMIDGTIIGIKWRRVQMANAEARTQVPLPPLTRVLPNQVKIV